MPEIEIPARLHRAAAFDVRKDAEGEGDANRIAISFSSEEPVLRWFGWEVLGHKPGEANLAWVNSGRAPLLADHRNAIGAVLGVIESASIEGGKGRAVVRFADHPEAREAFAKVRAGVLGNISVGYSVERLERDGVVDGEDVFRAIRWTPREISLVAAPADTSVGVGRSAPAETVTIEIKEGDMPKDDETRAAAPAAPAPAPANPQPAAPTQRGDGDKGVEAMLADARKAERERCAEIDRIGAAFNIAADVRAKAKADGMTVDAFRGVVLDHLGDAGQERMNAASAIGLTEREAQRFSLVRLIHALASDRTDRHAIESARFEFEACEAAAATARGRTVRGALIPTDVLVRRDFMAPAGPRDGRRDLQVGDGGVGTGGQLVATDMSGSFIDALRARAFTIRAGATVLEGLVGNVAIPKLTGVATAHWVAESTPPAESTPSVGQVKMTAHTVAANVDFSRRLGLQASLSVEGLVRADLLSNITLAIDHCALNGSADVDAPDGIADDVNINVVDFATDAAPTWAEVVQCWGEVAGANAAMGQMAYALHPLMAAYLMSTPKVPGDSGMMMTEDNRLAGFPAEVTTQVPAPQLWFGDWSSLIIGFWSGLDIVVDPYSLSTAGVTRVTAFQDADFGIRHSKSFCKGVMVP